MERYQQQASSSSNNQLQDGFQELFTFRGHRLQLRGFNTVESLEDTRRVSRYSTEQHYVSWDAKQVLLWSHNSFDPNSKPIIINQVKFSNQPNYICAIVHALKMKVFLAAALDMSFKIFDNHLQLLESIHHDERAILQMEYDNNKELIFTSGANGVSAWRLYRNLNVDKAHIMEKMYNFSGCDTWITNMIYQPLYNRIYAVKENTVQVLSTTRRAVVTALENIHDAPINVVCWYERNQFYLTGCSRGEIKCWTLNYNQLKGGNNKNSTGNVGSTLSNLNMSSNSSKKNFSLLHSFKGHTKGVTAIHLHPISGLAISASLDGMMRVLNLEALNELFSIQVGCGILGLRVVKLCNNNFGCLASLCDGTIKLWKITAVCDFFAVASSKIAKLDIFDNLEAELEYHYKMKMLNNQPVKSDPKVLSVVEQLIKDKVSGKMSADGNKDRAQSPSQKPIPPPIIAVKTDADKYPDNDDDSSTVQSEGNEGKDSGNKKEGFPAASAIKANGNAAITGGEMTDKILVTYSTQDLRAFTHNGVLLGRLEPEHVVNGIKALCVSVYQKLLFCLCEGDRFRVFDMRRFNFPLIYEFSLKNPGATSTTFSGNSGPRQDNPYMEMIKQLQKGIPVNPNGQVVAPTMGGTAEVDGEGSMDGNETTKGPAGAQGNSNDEDDIGVCCTLIDIPPSSSLRAPKFSATADQGGQSGDHLPPRYDPRGERVPHYIECFLLVGLNNGTIMFLDVLNRFEVIMNFSAINGIILDMKYRRRHKELLVYSKDYAQVSTSIRIWKLPDMELVGELHDIKKVCSFAPSYGLNFFALGCADGTVRLYANQIEDKSIREIQRIGENHDTPIISICFIDDLRVYCSCSMEGKVKFWDFDKRLVKTIQLNIPTCGIVQNGILGSVVMAQNHYLLTIPKRIWDEDESLNRVRAGGGDGCFDLTEDSVNNPHGNQNGSSAATNANANANPNGTAGPENDQQTVSAGSVGSRGGNESAQGGEKEQGTTADTAKGSGNDDESAVSDKDHHNSAAAQFHRKFSVTGGTSGGGNSDRRASRRYSKSNTNLNVLSLLAHGSSHQGSSSDMKRRGSSLQGRKSSRILVMGAHGGGSHQQSASSLRSSASDDEDTAHRNGQNSSGKTDDGVNLDEIEREIILPSLKNKQFQFISRKNKPTANSHGAMEVFTHGSLDDFPKTSGRPGRDSPDAVVYQPNDSLMLEMKHQVETSKSMLGGDSASELSSNSLVMSLGGPMEHGPSIGGGDTLDVLHPRFLVHKKPPARVLQLEDIDAHVSKYVNIMSEGKQRTESREYDVQSAGPPSGDKFDTRRFAQFGLSPRARMTLLNTVPNRPSQPPPSHTSFAPRVSSGGEGQQSVSARTSGASLSEDALLTMKAQEQLILGLSLGMNVSNEYKQQRTALNQERQQRFTSLKRSTMIVIKPHSPLSKDRGGLRSGSATNPTIEEDEMEDDENTQTSGEEPKVTNSHSSSSSINSIK